MQEYAQQFYKSKAWLKCRNTYFKSKHGICERCGGTGLIVHHKKHITPMNINNADITLNEDNFELVCLDCHNKEHMCSGATQDGLIFNDCGDLVPPYSNSEL